jgi:hypothetical protein
MASPHYRATTMGDQNAYMAMQLAVQQDMASQQKESLLDIVNCIR